MVINIKIGDQDPANLNDRLEANNDNDWLLSGLSGDDTLIGRGGDDTLRGGDDADFLEGRGGDDILNGGAGDDILEGGAGNDIYHVENVDFIVEVSGANGGTDTVLLGNWNPGVFLDAFWLPAYVENMSIQTTFAGWAAYGNDLDNEITGNQSTDRLYGAAGNDRMKGAAGSDFLYGEAGHDNLRGGDGDDFLYGDFGGTTSTGGNDTLIGGAGNDLLAGGAGADVLTGYQSSTVLGQSDTLDGGSLAVGTVGDGAEDTYVLGDANGLYYTGGGAIADGYATIRNWEQGIDTIVISGSYQDYVYALEQVSGAGGLATDLVIYHVNNLSDKIAVIADNTFVPLEADFSFV